MDVQHTRHPLYLWITRGLFFGFIVLSAGCAGAPSPLAPASSNVQLIRELMQVIFAIAAVVFVIVESALVYTAIRFSRQRGEGLPDQIEGNRTLEIAWTLAPAIVLAIVFVVSLQTLRVVAASPFSETGNSSDSSTQLNVRVVGHQWWWEFDYPDLGIVTADELHVPVGTRINASVESGDVIHSFWVPQLASKIDTIPGHVNHTWFQATQVGTYHGQCAEFCGEQHANMRLQVIVETPDQFRTWVKQQQAPVAAMTGDVAKGEQEFMNGACIGCHTINTTKAQGKVGPNLTHLATRQTFAGAILDNTPQNLAKWLADPQAVKPGTLMPNLHLTPAQIDALVTYLSNLK